MNTYSDAEHVNVGSGEDGIILELTQLICEVVGFKGEILQDLSKPNGMPIKLISADKIRDLGWQPKIGLKQSVEATYCWYQKNVA